MDAVSKQYYSCMAAARLAMARCGREAEEAARYLTRAEAARPSYELVEILAMLGDSRSEVDGSRGIQLQLAVVGDLLDALGAGMAEAGARAGQGEG
jgi:hypothetical protein